MSPKTSAAFHVPQMRRQQKKLVRRKKPLISWVSDPVIPVLSQNLIGCLAFNKRG